MRLIHRIEHTLVGILLMLTGIYHSYHFLGLAYAYRYTDILFAFKLPDYVLVINTVFGSIITLFGVLVLLKKQETIRSLLITLLLIAAGILLQITATR